VRDLGVRAFVDGGTVVMADLEESDDGARDDEADEDDSDERGRLTTIFVRLAEVRLDAEVYIALGDLGLFGGVCVGGGGWVPSVGELDGGERNVVELCGGRGVVVVVVVGVDEATCLAVVRFDGHGEHDVWLNYDSSMGALNNGF